MCIGLPGRVLRVVDGNAEVDTGYGHVRSAYIATPERVRKGDYVMLYANLITEKTDRRSALEILQYMREMAAAGSEDQVHASKASGAYEKRARRLAGPPASRRS